MGLIGRDHEQTYATGKRFFLWGMVLASGAGIGYAGILSPFMPAFMHTPGIWALTVAIVLSQGSLHFFFAKVFLPSGLMLSLSVAGMVTARHYVRLVKLQGQFDPAAWRVTPQWSPLILFLICLVVAAVAVFYMLRLLLAAKAGRA